MKYFWIVSFTETKDGRPRAVIMNKKALLSERQAERVKEKRLLPESTEVFETESSSKSEATREIKGQLITRYRKEGKPWDNAMTNAVHTKEE